MKTDEEIINNIYANKYLLEFLAHFINNIKDLFTGRTYTSRCNKYQISYLEFIKDDGGGAHPTPIRIHHSDNYFEVNKVNIPKYTAKQMLYLFLNCFAQNMTDGDHKRADFIAFYVMDKLEKPLTLEDINYIYGGRNEQMDIRHKNLTKNTKP